MSIPMLDPHVEKYLLLTEQEYPAYIQFLQGRLREDRFPSIPMLSRLVNLVS